jgi:hypothetical protein
MSETPTPKNSVANALKIYLFPSLVTILAMLIWRDVTELRNDVKALLAQSNIDKTKIENLEKDVKILEQAVFNKRITASAEVIDLTEYRDKYFKHEDIFDITKYIPKF